MSSNSSQDTQIHGSSDQSARADALIAEFRSNDGAVRARARHAVVKLGPVAIGGLVNALNHPEVRMRWEATKALCELADPAAAPGLIGRLEGTDSGVRWMAADGLIAMGPAILEPVLQILIQRSDSILLREGAHRVLHGLAGRGNLQAILQPVMDAMAAIEPAVVVPLAAYRALERLRESTQTLERGITIRRVRVRDWMRSELQTVEPDATLDVVHRLMKEHQIRHMLIVSQDRLVGIVSLGDVREAMASGASVAGAAAGIATVMTRNVLTIRPDATLREAARIMLANKIGGLPVMEGSRLVGIITESDVYRVLIQELPAST